MIIHAFCIPNLTRGVLSLDLNNCSFSPASLSAMCLLQLCVPATQKGVRAALQQDSKTYKARFLPLDGPITQLSSPLPFTWFVGFFFNRGYVVWPRGAMCAHQHFMLTGTPLNVPLFLSHYLSFHICKSGKIWMQAQLFMIFEILSWARHWNSSNPISRDLQIKM